MARLPAQAGVCRVLIHGARDVRSLTVVPQPV
jgi:hypothetical protein